MVCRLGDLSTGSSGSVKTGIEELFDRQLPDFGHKGDETKSFRRPWKSSRIEGPSSVYTVPVLLSHFVSVHAHTSERAHGALHDALHGTPHCTTIILAALLITLTAVVARAYASKTTDALPPIRDIGKNTT